MNEYTIRNEFEQRLLDHVEMLYAVALRLTLNTRAAERLTRRTMLRAWPWWSKWDDSRSLKFELLQLLRRLFVDECGDPALLDILRAIELDLELCDMDDSEALSRRAGADVVLAGAL